MVENWNIFKPLISEINDLKRKLKNEAKRKNFPVCSFFAKSLFKKISAAILKVYNGKNIKDNEAIELFTFSIRKLNILIRELLEYRRIELAHSLQNIEQRLIFLLPANTYFQLELFESEPYKTEKANLPMLKGFRKWLKYHFATPRLGLNPYSINSARPILAIQPSFPLSC